MPNTPCGNSSISPAIVFSTPCTRAMPSPIDDDRADFGDVDVDRVAADLVADDLGDFFCSDVHVVSCYFSPRPRWSGTTAGGRGVPAAPFTFCNWVVTLPSYTVLPMRATAPPMIDGSTRVSSCTCAAGRARQPLLQRRDPVLRQFDRGGELRRARPARSPSAVLRRRSRARATARDGRARPASAAASTRSGVSGPRREQLFDDGALALRRNGRIGEHARQHLVAGDEPANAASSRPPAGCRLPSARRRTARGRNGWRRRGWSSRPPRGVRRGAASCDA